LLLSKIENRQFATDEQVDFNARLRQQVDDFSELLRYRGIDVDVDEKSTLTRFFNTDLADVLIANLIKNAIVHNHADGLIRIAVVNNGFEIANTGPARPLENEKMFARFYRSSDSSMSTGLGLAVAKAIVELHRAELTYRYEGGLHCFRV